MRALAIRATAAGMLVAGCSSHAPEIHLSALRGTAIDGSQVGSSQTTAKVLVLNFMGSWCAPCIAEADGFSALADSYKSRGVAFVGVAEKENGQVGIRTFIAAHHIHYPVLFDTDARLELRVAPQAGIPTTLVFRSGLLVQRLYGALEYTELRDAISAALRTS